MHPASRVLRIHVTLPDADGRLVPVAHHRLLISDNPATAPPRSVVTSRDDGTAVVTLQPGKYTVESDEPFVGGGKAYLWWKAIDVPAGRETVIELTAADAEVETPQPASASGAAQTQGVSLHAMKKVTSGFSGLRAFCDQTEVRPVQPSVLERQFSSAATTEGLFVFDSSAFGPTCRNVTLELYSEKAPDKGETLGNSAVAAVAAADRGRIGAAPYP